MQLENRLTEFENEKSNSTNDLSALIERDEYTKKSLAKVFTKVDEMDAKLDSVASGKFDHQLQIDFRLDALSILVQSLRMS